MATLSMRSKPVVFVGTAAGANQPFTVEGARTVKSLWGLIAVKLGGWRAYICAVLGAVMVLVLGHNPALEQTAPVAV